MRATQVAVLFLLWVELGAADANDVVVEDVATGTLHHPHAQSCQSGINGGASSRTLEVAAHAAEVSRKTNSDDSTSLLMERLIFWIREQGGFVSGKLRAQKREQQRWGLVTTQTVEADELLLSIPSSCLLTVDVNINSDKEEDDEDDNDSIQDNPSCPLLEALLWERSHRNASHFFPFVEHVFQQAPTIELNPPRVWSRAGQDFLWRHVLGATTEGAAPLLPPRDVMAAATKPCQSLGNAREEAAARNEIDNDEAINNHALMLHWIHQHAHTFRGRGKGGRLMPQQKALVPLLDLIQQRHSNSSNAHYELALSTLRSRDDNEEEDPEWEFRLVASQVLSAFQTISVASGGSTTSAAVAGGDVVYGMPQYLRDFGLVEPDAFPQTWGFSVTGNDNDDDNEADETGVAVSFTLDHNTTHDDESTEDEYQLQWIVGYHEEDLPQLVHFLTLQVDRLYETGQLLLLTENAQVAAIPASEGRIIRDYHRALLRAVESVLELVDASGWCEEEEDEEHTEYGEEEGEDAEKKVVCHMPTARYSLLDTLYDDYHRAACDEQAEVDKIVENYDVLETIESPYQDIVTLQDPETGNVCFELDNIYQICTSYRPHYHEMVVHYTARFLPRIERVLFVGGGDAMLLHEILQYHDEVELVVGLELDQHVTRNSFRYYGVQPHYDQPKKVQWWYGNAANSLLMLPHDWFGTFDLVLVDLSETVMSFQVTDGLDILTALSLLLKPEGIFVKNEMYFEKLNQIFPYSIQLKYDDVPLICKQCLAMGSFATDFIETNLTQHDSVRTLFAPLDFMDEDLILMHDYHRNYTARQRKRACTAEGQGEMEQDASETQQQQSPGLLLVLEVEDAEEEFLQSPMTLLNALVPALEVVGFTVVSSLVPSEGDDQTVVIVMAEGYVTARGWDEFYYCGLDIYLWSAFDRLPAAERALVQALTFADDLVEEELSEASSWSAFRIVVGGMFGASKWQQDSKLHGPHAFMNGCSGVPAESSSRELGHEDRAASETEKMTVPKSQMDDCSSTDAAHTDFLRVALNESLEMWRPYAQNSIAPILAAVICGHAGEPCQSFDVIADKYESENVIPIWTCPNISDDGNWTVYEMFNCETQILSTLEKHVVDVEQKINMLVLDPDAPMAMARILHKIARSETTRTMLFTPSGQVDMMILAPGLTEDSRRKAWVSQFAPFFPHEPGYWSHATFRPDAEACDTMFELCSFVAGDPLLTSHLKQLASSIQTRLSRSTTNAISDWVAKVEHVGGVEFRHFEDFRPTQFFSDKDYDQREPYQQWLSQQPLGHQTMFQMELVQPGEHTSGAVPPSLSENLLRYMLDAALAAANVPIILESQAFSDMGDGTVLVALFSRSEGAGGVTIVWDGRGHVDVNLFTPLNDNDAEEGDDFASRFSEQFVNAGAYRAGVHLKVVLCDEMPRGYGRVVSFATSLENGQQETRPTPHWAWHVTDSEARQ